MHKLHRAAATTLVALATTTAVMAVTGPAEAVTRFANCTAMHNVYPHGVAKGPLAANYQVRQGYGRPAVRPLVYSVNSFSDRDKDGTACEA